MQKLKKLSVLCFFSFFLLIEFSSCMSKREGEPKVQNDIIAIQNNDPPVFFSENIEGNRFAFTVNNVTYEYYMDFPLQGSDFSPDLIKNSPLVIMIHGANNTGESFRYDTLFHEPANERGYTVVYVTAAAYNKAGVIWNSGIFSEGNDDLLFFRTLVQYLENEFELDPARTFAIGFSNGGFMVHRLAMEAGDVFEACVSVGAKMPAKIWNERKEKNNIGYFQITGEKDDVVPKNSDGSVRFSKDPAIEDVMDYWAESNGLTKQTQEEIGDGSILFKWEKPYLVDRVSSLENQPTVQVWHLVVKDGRHAWPSIRFNKIDTNALILDFLDFWSWGY